MIRTINDVPADNVLKPHFMYQFIHHDMLFRAYDETGRGLSRLREEIGIKYGRMKEDKSRYVYYLELIQNLERQFSRMVLEGRHNGSVEIIRAATVYVNETRKERKVA